MEVGLKRQPLFGIMFGGAFLVIVIVAAGVFALMESTNYLKKLRRLSQKDAVSARVEHRKRLEEEQFNKAFQLGDRKVWDAEGLGLGMPAKTPFFNVTSF